MIKQLKLELFKLANYSSFWIILAIFSSIFIITSLIVGNLGYQINFLSEVNSMDFSKYLKFPYIWKTYVWIGGWFSYLWGLMIILIIGNELSNKMLKQQILWGMKRKEIFLSKIIILLILPIVLILIIIVLVMILGLKNTPNADFGQIIGSSGSMIYYYIQAIATMSLALVFAFLVNSSTLSILLFFAYTIFEGIFRLILKSQFGFNFVDFFPLKAINSLTPRPSLEIALSPMLQQQLNIQDAAINQTWLTVIIAVFYIAAFWFIIYKIIMKRDFK